MKNDILNDKVIAIVWGLESGFKNEDKFRDRWFATNRSFVVRQDVNHRLAFTSLNAFMMEGTYEKPDVTEHWITDPVKLVEKSDDGSYRAYETEDGTRYHIYKKGTIEKF